MYESNRPDRRLHIAVNDFSENRRDMRSAQIVLAGIALQEKSGTLCAFEYLRGEGINESVCQRVLNEPALRRNNMHNR
jgi:hypothetical protein